MTTYIYKDFICFRVSRNKVILPIGEYKAFTIYRPILASPKSVFNDVIFDCNIDFMYDCIFLDCVFTENSFELFENINNSPNFVNCRFHNCDFSGLNYNLKMGRDCSFTNCKFNLINPFYVDNSCIFDNCFVSSFQNNLKCILNTQYYNVGVVLFDDDTIQYYYEGELVGDSIEFKQFISDNFDLQDGSIEFSRFQDVLNSMISEKVISI